MKIEKACGYVLKEPKVDLIFESVYANEIFDELVSYVAFGVEHFPFYVKLTYEVLSQHIRVKWKLKKFLSKTKVAYACLSDEVEKLGASLKLSRDDISKIKGRLEHDDGVFISDLSKGDSVALVIINENLEHSELKNVLFHELVHFFQWSTGKTMENVLGEDGLDMSKEDMIDISNAFKIDSLKTKSLIEQFFSPDEREAYYESIARRCIEVLNIEDKSRRNTFKWFIQLFKSQESMHSFKDYYENVSNEIEKFGVDRSCLRFREMKLLLIYGYYKISFTSMFNHLLGYFDRRFGN